MTVHYFAFDVSCWVLTNKYQVMPYALAQNPRLILFVFLSTEKLSFSAEHYKQNYVFLVVFICSISNPATDPSRAIAPIVLN